MRFSLAILLMTCASAPAAALDLPQASPAGADAVRPGESGRPIVVTGIRIQDYRDRLAACLARHCPVNEDVDATLALAEAHFLNGDYSDGRQAVRASIGRNRDQAAAFPEPVSDLFRAHTRLSRHLGYDDQAARSANDILRALQAGLPQEDYRHFTARLEIADLQMAMGNATRARRELAELARAARAANRDDVVAMAELRTIWFDHIVYAHGDAKSRLIEMARATDPAQRFRATGAKILLARIYRSEGDAARADALLAEVGHGNGAQAQRRLISSPPTKRNFPGPPPPARVAPKGENGEKLSSTITKTGGGKFRGKGNGGGFLGKAGTRRFLTRTGGGRRGAKGGPAAARLARGQGFYWPGAEGPSAGASPPLPPAEKNTGAPKTSLPPPPPRAKLKFPPHRPGPGGPGRPSGGG